jgi:hypothetical protein
MFTITESIPVNVPGEPVLDRANVWDGLVAKSRDAVPYVDAMTYCKVVDEISPTVFDRDIEFHGEYMKERITLEPQECVTFERLSGSVLGTIWNTVEENAAGELFLRFTFSLSVSGIAAGSREEQAYAQTMKAGYMRAVATTLATIRRTAREAGVS